MLEYNRQPNHPVAKIKAVNNGRHAVKADSNKAGGLLPLLYLCCDSKVMLVVNLKADWGFYNGAVAASAGSIATGMGNNNPQVLRDDCGCRRSI